MPETEEGKKLVSKNKGSKFQWPKFKIPHKYVMYDKFHRGAVLCLISASVIIFVRICVDLRHYYKVRSPILHEIARLDKETKMEEMQKEREEAFKLQKTLQEEANKV